MPELPEVETIARDLRARVVGATIEAIWTSGKALRLARPIDDAALHRIATGARVLGVRRKGKYVLVDLSPRRSASAAPAPSAIAQKAKAETRTHSADRMHRTKRTTTAGRSREGATLDLGSPPSAAAAGAFGPGVLFHLGMSGRLQVEPAESPRLAHTHVIVRLGGGLELRFRDPRRFGWIIASDAIDACTELASLGPDPLAELTPEMLAAELEGTRAPIKAFLLDQTRVAGLGNIYACEALFRARIHPAVPARRAVRRTGILFEAIRQALLVGIENRGTTLRDYVDSFGSGGNNAQALLVYGRTGLPCVTCRRPIRRRVDGGRSTFYCGSCQRW